MFSFSEILETISLCCFLLVLVLVSQVMELPISPIFYDIVFVVVGFSFFAITIFLVVSYIRRAFRGGESDV